MVIFEIAYFETKLRRRQKSMVNYPACRIMSFYSYLVGLEDYLLA